MNSRQDEGSTETLAYFEIFTVARNNAVASGTGRTYGLDSVFKVPAIQIIRAFDIATAQRQYFHQRRNEFQIRNYGLTTDRFLIYVSDVDHRQRGNKELALPLIRHFNYLGRFLETITFQEKVQENISIQEQFHFERIYCKRSSLISDTFPFLGRAEPISFATELE